MSTYRRSLSLIFGLDVTVGILRRKDVFCGDFVLFAVAAFRATPLVGIYPGRPSIIAGFSAYVIVLLGVSIEGD